MLGGSATVPTGRKWRTLVSAWLFAFAGVPAWAGELTVDFLDIGQGDSILIRGGGKTVLIDAGDRGSNTVRQLQGLGVERLDLVVATHPHADHIGRMAPVLRTFEIGLYLDNGLPHTTATYAETMEAVEERGISYKTAEIGTQLRLGDEATLTVLFPTSTPLEGTRSDLNSNSVVTLLEHGEVEMLFTGDAEEPTEQALLRGELPKQIDVLKVAHHGSEHSSTTAFLRHVEPEFAVISCGVGNRYRHPREEALRRLESAGAMVFRTDLSGRITAISDGSSVEFIEQGKEDAPRVVARRPAPFTAGTPAAVVPPGPTLVETPDAPEEPAAESTDEGPPPPSPLFESEGSTTEDTDDGDTKRKRRKKKKKKKRTKPAQQRHATLVP